MSNIHDRLRDLRKVKGLTQKDVATAIGKYERTYRRYEAGEIEPPASTVSKIADFFDVSADYLLCRTDNPKSHL